MALSRFSVERIIGAPSIGSANTKLGAFCPLSRRADFYRLPNRCSQTPPRRGALREPSSQGRRRSVGPSPIAGG